VRQLPYELAPSLTDQQAEIRAQGFQRDTFSRHHYLNDGYPVFRGMSYGLVSYAAFDTAPEPFALVQAGVSWVHSDYRRQGIGTNLYAIFAEYEGFEVVTLDGRPAVIAKPALDIDTQRFTLEGANLLCRVYENFRRRGLLLEASPFEPGTLADTFWKEEKGQ
jgi:GNAT superfamily N-acetyltransferase